MDRQSLFFKGPNDPPTFAMDETMPDFPLPDLDSTLDRYYESLLPFGTPEELAKSREIIRRFKEGVGPKLHQRIVDRTKVTKNWVESWWDQYAYLSLRFPLLPYTSMAQPFCVASAGVEESRENAPYSFGQSLHHIFEYWKLMRTETLKTAKLSNGKMLSQALNRKFYSTVRVPGEDVDEIVCHFRTEKEGDCPTHFILMGRGRIFRVEGVNPDGSILSPQQCTAIYLQVQGMLEAKGEAEHPVPLLTYDDRTNWAKNRTRLQSLSENNRLVLQAIEESTVVTSLDGHEPRNYSELSQLTVTGDMLSKWSDKSTTYVAFKNGTFGCIGEHSSYDGTISIAATTFVLLSLMETGSPDWSAPVHWLPQVVELQFDLDDGLRAEVQRMRDETRRLGEGIIVTTNELEDYGKDFIKTTVNVHPDSYVQMVLQLAYYRMHERVAATYETALMRFYYNGRTETVRSCSLEALQWVEGMQSAEITIAEKVRLFKRAVQRHMEMQLNARDGKGIDRHLFGLWCAAFERNEEIPELFDDPLYTKSGGGGNYVLSTSTLGFTINNGFVGPMVMDGYGVFYTITNDSIWLNMTTYRDSATTSNQKFINAFQQALRDVQAMIKEFQRETTTTATAKL